MLDTVLSYACDLDRGIDRTAIRPALLTGSFYQGGVYQLQNFLAGIHHHDPAEDPHLGRRKAHTLGIHQGLFHIVQKLAQPPVKFLHRPAYLVERRVLIRKNPSKSHICRSPYSNPFTSTKAVTPRLPLSAPNCRSKKAKSCRSLRFSRQFTVSR